MCNSTSREQPPRWRENGEPSRLESTVTSDHVLPVWKTVGETYHFAARYWWRLAVMGVPFVAVTIFLTWPPEFDLPAGPFMIPGHVEPMSWTAMMLLWLRLHLTYAAIFSVPAIFGLVAVHRLALLDDRGPHALWPFRVGMREVRFLVVLLIVSVPAIFYDAASLPLLLRNMPSALGFAGGAGEAGERIAQIIWILLIWSGKLAVMWLTLRLALGLPPAALDVRRPIRTGWRLGRGNNWRLIGASILCVMPAYLVFLGVMATDHILTELEFTENSAGNMATGEIRPVLWTYAMPIVDAAVLWAMVVLGAVMLSLCYRQLRGSEQSTVPET